ncbi:MAG: LemA family protein [Methanobacteriota archaeon]
MVATGLILGIVLVAVVLLLVLWYVGTYNGIIRAENRIDNAWSQIDVQLKRRVDLIPNLVETVKGYAKHERETFEKVTAARAALVSARSPGEAMDANNMLTGALKSLFAVAEAYPTLKADKNFLELQDELTHTENKVAFARQYYNDSVLDYNNSVETMPSSVVAGMMGRKERPMFAVPPEAREAPKVSF